jgi:uncharacterized protein (TIGR03083 family)
MSELDRIVQAWSQTLTDTIALGEQLSEDDWARPTECPEWTVKDVYAHLVGGEHWMADGHPAPPEGLARIADGPVESRKGVSGPAVLAELRAILAHRQEQLAAGLPDPDAPTMTAYLQPVTVGILYRMRAFDAWVHEQDIRRAVGVPGNLDSPSAKISRTLFVGSLPRVVAKAAAAPPGSSVRVDVAGPVAFDLAIEVGPDGRGVPSQEPPERPTVTLRTDWETFSRLMAGRIDPGTAPVTVEGDADLAGRVLFHLAITP